MNTRILAIAISHDGTYSTTPLPAGISAVGDCRIAMDIIAGAVEPSELGLHVKLYEISGGWSVPDAYAGLMVPSLEALVIGEGVWVEIC